MKNPRFLTLILLLLLTPWQVQAKDHYSFELEEKLTPLIEWRDYGPAAFDEAIEKNKPIFMLLTAPSWCYWCQVYGSDEYLYNDQVYPYINGNFIPIYVDADRRQDLTRQYLEGGWPSTTVMAPNRERLYGFSGPRPITTMLSQMEQAVAYVSSSGFATQELSSTYRKTSSVIPKESDVQFLINSYTERAMSSFDTLYGGFGQGRKFPQPRTLMAFLDRYEETNDIRWLQMVETTLQNQYTKIEEIETNYNLFDPVEGGFHRYGTDRQYTPPHYEKMLYDNAKFLQLYARLADLNGNPLAKEVSEETFALLETWYDAERGGFAGNTSAFEEEHYYGKAIRPQEKPRIEWTKYTDWNSDAVIAFLDVGERRKDQKALAMSEKTLSFFLSEMLDENGPYHFFSTNGKRGVQGNLPDSASLLVASIEGYQKTGKQEFLAGAIKIADFALENLYDWHGGGFFERNSADTELYAATELFLSQKPGEENGMMSYGLLLLFDETDDVRYLNAAVKTIGRFVNRMPSLDRGYFLYRAAQVLAESKTLTAYEERQEEIARIDAAGKASFFLKDNGQLKNPPAPPKKFVLKGETNEILQGSFLLLLLIALIAGLLSFLSPCTLPILPAYFAAMLKTDPKRQIVMSISFLTGLALVFSLLGMSATVIGSFLRENLTIFTQVVGVIIMGFGLMTLFGKGFGGLNITNRVIPSGVEGGHDHHASTPLSMTPLGPFLFGGALALAWTPCVGPILVAMLALASTLSSSLQGGLLLLIYALGLGLPLILFSSLLQRLPRDGKLWRTLNGKWTSVVAGLIFLLLGYLIFSGTLTSFNQYVTGTGFQKWFFTIENWLLQLL